MENIQDEKLHSNEKRQDFQQKTNRLTNKYIIPYKPFYIFLKLLIYSFLIAFFFSKVKYFRWVHIIIEKSICYISPFILDPTFLDLLPLPPFKNVNNLAFIDFLKWQFTWTVFLNQKDWPICFQTPQNSF